MATPLTEVANFDSQVVVPDDGVDDETAASLVPAFQSLTDRTRALKPTLDWTTAGTAITPSGPLLVHGGHGMAIDGSFTADLGVATAPGGDISSGGDLVAAGDVNGTHFNAASSILAASNIISSGGAMTAHDNIESTNGNVRGLNVVATAGNVTATGSVTAGTFIQAATSINCTGGAIAGTQLFGKRMYAIGTAANADTTYSPSTVDLVYIPFGSSLLTADRNYTIGTAGAVDGMWIEFANYSVTHFIKILGLSDNPGGINLRNTTTNFTWLKAIHLGGQWIVHTAIASYI